MSTALQTGRALTTAAAGRTPATLTVTPAPPLARRTAARLGNAWVPHAAWAIGRTGRAGLLGVALLLGAGLFLASTHLKIASEVEALRAELASARERARAPEPEPEPVADPAAALRALPAQAEMPALLRQLFGNAARARLAVDTARYEVKATRSGAVVRHQIAFAASGPYPQIRAFIDATLATMPALALSDLVLERKSISEGDVDAQIRMTIYTRSDP